MTPDAEAGGVRGVIRAPNHLGELVLALPALEAAADSWPTPPLVQVVAELAPVLDVAGVAAETVPLRGRHRVLRAALALRRRGPDVGVLLTPSFSAALVFALAGIGERRGTDTDGRGWLLTDRVDRGPLLEGHRVREYLELVGAGDGASPGPGLGGARGRAARNPGRGRPAAPEQGHGEGPGPGASGGGPLRGDDGGLPRPRLRRLAPARAAWRAFARGRGIEAAPAGPVVGLVPGGRAPARRWPAERYGELAERLAGRGCRIRVFGGAGEGDLTARVAGDVAGARDLGGRTGLLELAGGLAACDLVMGNDTGPLHLAAAAGRPVVVVWGSGDPRQTRPLGPSVRLVGRLDLPCHPCLESACPRRGAGYRSERARRECLRLVGVDEVEEAATASLAEARARPRAAGHAAGNDRSREGRRDA